MTHEPERTFHDRVLTLCRAMYGEANVESNAYMSETGRFCDIMVETGVVRLAIEVENDWEACVKGVGQALMYSARSDTMGVVVTPEGHVEEPEHTILSATVPIIEIGFEPDSSA